MSANDEPDPCVTYIAHLRGSTIWSFCATASAISLRSASVLAKPRLTSWWCAVLSCGEECDGFLISRRYLQDMTAPSSTSVLYNSKCSICSAEIGHYARYAGKAGLTIQFDDLNIDAWSQWGLDRDKAARRFYVHHDGVLTSGVPAFLALWAQMPRYRLLGKLLGLPGIKQLASAAYDYILAPALYRSHLRRLRKSSAGAAN